MPGVALALLALWLRLAWPMPIASVVSDRGFGGFDEHALCLATAPAEDPASRPQDSSPPPAGDHADHERSLCCLWHTAAGFTLAAPAPAVPIAFAATLVPRFLPQAEHGRTELSGAFRARGPPVRV